MAHKELMQNKMMSVCDRPGPVLEPEVRGCTEELRRILAQTLQGGD